MNASRCQLMYTMEGEGTNASHLALTWVVSQQVPLWKLITEVVTALEDSRCKSNNLGLCFKQSTLSEPEVHPLRFPGGTSFSLALMSREDVENHVHMWWKLREGLAENKTGTFWRLTLMSQKAQCLHQLVPCFCHLFFRWRASEGRRWHEWCN